MRPLAFRLKGASLCGVLDSTSRNTTVPTGDVQAYSPLVFAACLKQSYVSFVRFGRSSNVTVTERHLALRIGLLAGPLIRERRWFLQCLCGNLRRLNHGILAS